MSDQNIVIVGGGIWGLSTAYHLATMGNANVRVLERNTDTALETTPRAAGLVGQIRPEKTMCDAIQYALDLLSQFAEQTGHDPGLRRPGSLMVALTDERMDAYRQQVAQANQNGVEASFVSNTEMQRLAPAMDVSQLKGGYFVPGDGYLDPRQCAQSYEAAARDRGVQIELNTPVTALQIRDQKIAGVETANGVVPADQVVVTAGPWTGILAKRSGYELPMQTIRHQRVCTGPAQGIPGHHPAVRVTDLSCYVRPEADGYLYGFFEPNPTSIDLESKPSDFCTDDIEIPRETMIEGQRRLAPIFPILGELPIVEHRQGITTFAPDGQYLIGAVPNVEGLFVASGCAALGIAGSAAIGRWLANWVLNGEPDDQLAEFNPERFGAIASDREWIQHESERFYAEYYNVRP